MTVRNFTVKSSLFALLVVLPLSAQINFVQRNFTTSSPSASSVKVTYAAAQTAGNLNIVVVGWNDTRAAVSSVTDSRGNIYSRAVGPTAGTALTQSIYYARNIAAGSNTVTVTFNQTAAYPDVRVLEYSGADPSNPLDVTAAAAGTGLTANSGAATTTALNELIFGAGMTFDIYSAAGGGFTNRVITNFGDIAEDATGVSVGSYSATAAQRASAPWVMQVATFRARAQGSSNPAPTVTGITPSTGPTSGGTGVTITGTGFQSGATVSLGGTPATNVIVGSSTSITATTAAHAAGAVSVVVTNSDSQSDSLPNGYSYGNPTLTVTAITPNSGPASGGTAVTITGTGFQPGATVSLGGTPATNVLVGNGTSITATTAAHAAGAVSVVVTNPDSQSGSLANGYSYGNSLPTVTAVAPASGPVNGGTGVTITGTGFSAGATVTFGGTAATSVTVTSSGTITATTPAHAAGTVDVVVTNSDGQNGKLTAGYTYTATTSGAINFVQQKYTTSNPSASSVKATYAAAQTAGNLNIVVVGWNDTRAAVSSVTDSRGNSYIRAVGPTAGTALTQSIYYARNIVAGSNTVTVTFNQTAAYPDVRVLEYSGADPANPLDVTAAAAGTGLTANSGATTTTALNELIFGAGMTFDIFRAAGSGFTNRVITNFGDIAEDTTVLSLGSYSATAPLRSSAPWVMQMATFRASGQGSPNTEPPGAGRTYTTNFPLTENPISEGGNWINGRTLGLDWTNMRTTPGFAFATQSGTNPALYDDSVALLTGSWGADQSAQGTIQIGTTATGPCYQESELFLRGSMSPHSIRGYELTVGSRNDDNSYVLIVRWNGGFGNFTILKKLTGATYGVKTGDVWKATVVGSTITVYINGVQKTQVTDSTFASGNPGMGMYLESPSTCGSGAGNFGLSSYTATDQAGGGSTQTNPPQHSVSLTWAPPQTSAVAHYNVYRGTVSGGPYTLLKTNVTSTSYTDSTVKAGATYYYVTTSVNAAGSESVFSNQFKCVIPTP
jgi:hypothetical protein